MQSALQRLDPADRARQAGPLPIVPQQRPRRAGGNRNPERRPGRRFERPTDPDVVLGLPACRLGAAILYGAWRFRRQRWFIYGVGGGACSSCSGSSSARSARFCPPASERRAGRAATGRPLPRVRRHGRTRRRNTTRPSVGASRTTKRCSSLLDGAPSHNGDRFCLLAAVHFLLLSGADDPLADYYDTVAQVRGVPYDAPAGDVSAAFTSFCLPTTESSNTSSPPAPPRPTRSAAAPRCCRGSANAPRTTGGRCRSRCSTWGRRPV